MRYAMLLFLITGFATAVSNVWALGEIGEIQGGMYRSAVPVSEQVQFGDLKTTIQRTAVKIPDDYGKLMSITPAPGVAVLWFQNDEGVVRNVTIASDELWLIGRGGRIVKDK